MAFKNCLIAWAIHLISVLLLITSEIVAASSGPSPGEVHGSDSTKAPGSRR
ncbi:hypothetical protein Dsin_015006 [Dipteronia sinensis]|uniref:Uncharacterized protein n=1 Tax=Dipteronia sinensis TaxID=43782 RepID=A0AAE0AMV4_9ROSI|nr:hypothetical protein Dsin_015006 [Dipteronia sinensis]